MKNWLVKQTKNGQTVELGGVRAMTRKGAAFEACGAFRIGHTERHTISVEQFDEIEISEPMVDHTLRIL